MFSKIATLAILSVPAITGVLGRPLILDAIPSISSSSSCSESLCSLNGWEGISSMNGFDDFYGSGHFDSSSLEESITVVQEEEQVVCHSQSVEIVQQQLVVLQEMAKRIITEQICEVETQTFVYEQFISSVSDFSNSLSHSNGFVPGFNSQIAGLYSQLVNSDGSLSSNNLGFSGQDVNNHVVVPSGSNWNDSTSPAKIQQVQQAVSNAKTASKASH